MSRRSAHAELLASLSRVFGRRRLRWYLFGAQAVSLYGRPRSTADVDVTVEIDDNQIDELVRALVRAGFQLRESDWRGFFSQTRVLPLAHKKTKMPLDLVVAGSELERRCLEQVRQLEMEGVLVPVLAPEPLVALKVLAQRPRDIDDVRGILAVTGVDAHEVRWLLKDLEVALERSDLLPLFEKLREET